MKALTWKQPYAALMAKGKIETRRWATNYRGPVLICAAQKSYSLKDERLIAGPFQFQRIGNALEGYPFYTGKAIAVGELVDCRPMTPADEDACFVEYKEGLWCHIYENVREIEPVDFKGAQGWKNLTPEFISSLQYK